MNYKWKILQGKAKNLIDILSAIAKNKKMSKEQIKDFINNDILPHDPFLLTNMDKAVARINKAIKNSESLLILGDYDTDGQTAVSCLYAGLLSIYSNVSWKVPHRIRDGYGINKNLIDEAYQNSVNLIITVDNGITAHEQIKYANSLGIDVIVTDHHQLNSNGIPTEITINPHQDNNYPFKNICGCMVAFKLIQALIPDLYLNEQLFNQLIIFITLATVADVMPLLNENRYYVKRGLELLNSCDNLGISMLMEKLELKNISVTDIGYRIAPCLNATGRLDTADLAVNLLLTEDITEANKIADKIIELNIKRQELQKILVEEIEKNGIDNIDNFIILKIEVEQGIIGIVAGDIKEKYNKPCFILSQKGDVLGGSGRSIDGYDIYQVIEKNRDLVSGGGHAAACGISIKEENLSEFKKRCNEDFNNWLKDNYKDSKVEPTKYAICEFPLSLISEKLVNNINKLQPYGQGNYEPQFATINVNISEYRIVGKNSDTIQFTFEQDGFIVKAIGFKNIFQKWEELNRPNIIDIIYSIAFNEWNDKITIQLTIKDIRLN